MPRADFVTSIVLVAFGIGVFVMALKMPRLEAQNINPYSAPGVVPTFLGAVIALLGVVLFIRSIVRGGHHLGITGATLRGFVTSDMTRRVALTIVVSAVYGWALLGRIPYPIATGLYVFAFIVLFEYRWKQSFVSQWKRVTLALLIGVLAAGLIAATFRYAFLVTLP